MKKIIPILIFLLFITSCGILPKKELPNEMPEDFNFIHVYGIGGNSINTIDETFSKEMGANEDHITIDFVFSKEEKEEIYQKIKAMGIQNYPDNISEGEASFGIPMQEYLYVICDGKEYKTCYGGFTLDVERSQRHEDFEELSSLIVSIIYRDEKVKSLPKSKGEYE